MYHGTKWLLLVVIAAPNLPAAARGRASPRSSRNSSAHTAAASTANSSRSAIRITWTIPISTAPPTSYAARQARGCLSSMSARAASMPITWSIAMISPTPSTPARADWLALVSIRWIRTGVGIVDGIGRWVVAGTRAVEGRAVDDELRADGREDGAGKLGFDHFDRDAAADGNGRCVMREVQVGSAGRSIPVIVLVLLAALAAIGFAFAWPW